MRTFYSDYINHCLRFYSRHSDPEFKSVADRENWFACDRAIKHFDEDKKEIILSLYIGGDTLADNIYNASKNFNVKQESIWSLVTELEKRVAYERGLI